MSLVVVRYTQHRCPHSLRLPSKAKVIAGEPVEAADQLLKQSAISIKAVRPIRSLKRVPDSHSSLETIQELCIPTVEALAGLIMLDTIQHISDKSIDSLTDQ